MAYLAVVHAAACRGGGRKGRPGALLAGIRPQGRRGQAARRRRAHPLGNAHAGEGAGDGAGARCSIVSPTRSLGDCCGGTEERRESADRRRERERAEEKMI